jgi:hypothetical protein
MSPKPKVNQVGRKGRVTLALSFAFFGLIAYLAVSWATRSNNPSWVPSPTTPSEPATLLVCRDANLDFGTIEPGGLREATVWLQNPGTDPVEIAEIRTSCDCFEVVLDRTIVPEGDQVKAAVKVDFGDDPSYRGKLRLEAEARARNKEGLAFLIKAIVRVANAK